MPRRNNTHSNSKCNADGNCYPDTNTNANCHSKTYSDAQAASNSQDPPNALRGVQRQQQSRPYQLATTNR